MYIIEVSPGKYFSYLSFLRNKLGMKLGRSLVANPIEAYGFHSKEEAEKLGLGKVVKR